MSRKKPEKIPAKEREQLLRDFWTAVSLLDDVDEIQAFFKDMLSETEAVMLARRLKIAMHLFRGMSYDKIQKDMKVSAATIASVHSWLDGGFGGYIRAIRKMDAGTK